MAKKFFNEKVYNPKKRIISMVIIGICIIGIIICFFVARSFSNKVPADAVVIVRDSVSIEVNSELPDNDFYFTELSGIKDENIVVNTDNVDISTIGAYDVLVKIHDEEYKVVFKVIDVTKPELILNSVSISEGETYDAMDFIASCGDNSGEQCIINFLQNSVDQEGNIIDYGSYSSIGTYEIKISSKDSSNNETIEITQLIIGTKDLDVNDPSENPTTPVTCNYGNLEYDSSNVLAYIVGVDNCALDLNLYQNNEIRDPVLTIADSETEKLKLELNDIANLSTNITVNRSINAVLNNTGNGLVGYVLLIEAVDSNGSILAKFYVDLDGNRIYLENPYNLE